MLEDVRKPVNVAEQLVTDLVTNMAKAGVLSSAEQLALLRYHSEVHKLANMIINKMIEDKIMPSTLKH